MRFEIGSSDRAQGIEMKYLSDEHSLHCIGMPYDEVVSSLLVGDLALDLDVNGTVLGISGYFPKSRWSHAQVTPPAADHGQLSIADHLQTPGVAYRLEPGADEWSISEDPSSGWIHIADKSLTSERIVKLSADLLFGVSAGSLAAIWIHPTTDDG